MLILQSPARSGRVLEAILHSVSSETEAFNIAVAYTTYQGARILIEGLSEALGDHWPSIPKCAVTCFDFGHTEPEALTFLQSTGFEVRIANLGAENAIRVVPNPSAFHPKIYMAPTSRGSQIVLGSANLSRRALTVNTEVVSTIAIEGLDVWQQVWMGLKGASVELYPDLLREYRQLRPRQRRQRQSDEPPIPPPTPPSRLRTFRSAVEAGIDPGEFSALWVEVGYVSGGSANQLELPRLAHRFFGYSFSHYVDTHATIGTPTLFVGDQEWIRPLTWHENNRMERINLPTVAQGGFSYANQVVLFERAGARFELTVASPGSHSANTWRNESAAAGTLFRISSGSKRLCGLI